MVTGTIFNIQRFSVDDGPGIRTTVFLKGCPLSCLWCHNPESNKAHTEIFFHSTKCIGCGKCTAVCPKGCHVLTDAQTDFHRYDRTACIWCGACAAACPTKALEAAGRTATVEEVLKEVRSDAVFYKESGGGMTVSGGEPLSQPAFTEALLTAAKAEGISTAMETCGYAPWEVIARMMPCTDLFLFDYKAEADSHKRLTGVDNTRILENLAGLSDGGASITLRCPIIPKLNDTQSHYNAIAGIAKQHSGIHEIHLEPYHPLGISKSEQLGKPVTYDNRTFLEAATLKPVAEAITEKCGKPVLVN